MLQDKELLTGEFLQPNGKARVNAKWNRMAETLNKISPGARKTSAQWKEVSAGRYYDFV